jgi:hypothetical protein
LSWLAGLAGGLSSPQPDLLSEQEGYFHDHEDFYQKK